MAQLQESIHGPRSVIDDIEVVVVDGEIGGSGGNASDPIDEVVERDGVEETRRNESTSISTGFLERFDDELKIKIHRRTCKGPGRSRGLHHRRGR